jgi:hypothetical protein
MEDTKFEGKRSLGIRNRSLEDNIKMYLGEIVCDDVNWIYLAQDRVQWQILVNKGTRLRLS